MSVLTDFEIEKVPGDLCKMMFDCNQRGLINSACWAAELYNSLNNLKINVVELTDEDCLEDSEFADLFLAKCYFDSQEYDRAAYVTKDSKSSEARFLHFYSIYCSSEKKKLDGLVDVPLNIDKKNTDLQKLKIRLQKEYIQGSLDGYCLYVYGVVLKKLQLDKEAMPVLLKAIEMEPLHWGSWLELSSLVTDRKMLNKLSLPNHWMKIFFLGHTYLELQMNELALEIYINLLQLSFTESSYVMGQICTAYYNMRDLDKALNGFNKLYAMDPYRLDNQDIHSNILYIREMKVELGNLAVKACKIDKYRVETCCIIGNFYSLRSQHEKAILYFRRALRINCNYVSAWTLMGHEYMVMKNSSSAVQAYRQAIAINRRDYRAWYGLGQTYESIKLYSYCLYYLKQAQQLRPHDPRIMVVLGDVFEKLEKLDEAKKCFWRAHALDDFENTALIKLAKIYEKLNENKQAVAAFLDYIKKVKTKQIDENELYQVYLSLARCNFKLNNFNEAYEYGKFCLSYPNCNCEDAANEIVAIASRHMKEETRDVSQLQNEGNNSSVMDFDLTP